jgi:hypothetical protein
VRISSSPRCKGDRLSDILETFNTSADSKGRTKTARLSIAVSDRRSQDALGCIEMSRPITDTKCGSESKSIGQCKGVNECKTEGAFNSTHKA